MNKERFQKRTEEYRNIGTVLYISDGKNAAQETSHMAQTLREQVPSEGFVVFAHSGNERVLVSYSQNIYVGA